MSCRFGSLIWVLLPSFLPSPPLKTTLPISTIWVVASPLMPPEKLRRYGSSSQSVEMPPERSDCEIWIREGSPATKKLFVDRNAQKWNFFNFFLLNLYIYNSASIYCIYQSLLSLSMFLLYQCHVTISLSNMLITRFDLATWHKLTRSWNLYLLELIYHVRILIPA